MTEGKLKDNIQRKFLSNRYSQPADIFPLLDKALNDFPDSSDFEDCEGEDDHWIFLGYQYKEAVEKWLKEQFGEQK
jgi:hypothetical protein